jgi:hypothetical protein
MRRGATWNLTDVYQPAVLDSNPASPTYGQTVRPHTHYGYDPAGDETSQIDANSTAIRGRFLTHDMTLVDRRNAKRGNAKRDTPASC